MSRPASLTISWPVDPVTDPGGGTVLIDAGRLVFDVATGDIIDSGGPHHFDDYFVAR